MANVTYYELNNIDQVHYQEAEILDKYSVELLQLEKLRKITLADGHILITEMIKKAKKNYSGTKIVRLNFREVRFAWFISQDKLIFT